MNSTRNSAKWRNDGGVEDYRKAGMEEWTDGSTQGWNSGIMEGCRNGRMEVCVSGGMECWNDGRGCGVACPVEYPAPNMCVIMIAGYSLLCGGHELTPYSTGPVGAKRTCPPESWRRFIRLLKSDETERQIF